MNGDRLAHVRDALAEVCGRDVVVTRPDPQFLRIVLEPVDDRGRVDVVASLTDRGWVVSDRGSTVRGLGEDADFVRAKLVDAGMSIRFDGDVVIAETDRVSFVDAVSQFVRDLEFIPVLAGLWSSAAADVS
ncbi:hypothetical protein [Ilumatobacter sp.]|uniref:hypothetical protein n=1 Tax=Ilumatobacter sp. TaxID=1967498 RepID=UPI003B515E8A